MLGVVVLSTSSSVVVVGGGSVVVGRGSVVVVASVVDTIGIVHGKMGSGGKVGVSVPHIRHISTSLAEKISTRSDEGGLESLLMHVSLLVFQEQ